MSESGLSPEDQEATPSAEETPAEAAAEPEVAATEGAAAVSAPAARSGGRRRALSWAAVAAVVVVVVLLPTTLLISHQGPAHSTTTGHGTPTATKTPIPLSVYGMVSSPANQSGSFPFPLTPVGSPVLAPAATQVTANEFALNAANGSQRWVDPTPNGDGEGQVVAKGVVYVGLSDGEVDALDAGTGKLLWRTTLLTFSEVQQVVNGVVYGWSTNDLSGDQPDGKYEVYALDAKTGKPLWQYDAGSIALVADGMVYAATSTGSSLSDITGVVHALNASTGVERWHVQIPGMLDVQMVSNGQLYVLGTQYTQEQINPATYTTLYAVDASSGTQRWSYPKNSNDPMAFLGVDAGVVSLFVQPGLNLQVGPFGALPADSLVGLNAADGAVRWQTEIPLAQDSSGETEYIGGGPPVGGLLSDGVAYITSVNDPPSAYNASTGKLLWRGSQFISGDRFPFLTLDLVANGVLYMEASGLTDNQGLYALDASTGKVLWQVLGKPLSVSAVVNGVVYASTDESDQALVGAPPASDNGIFALDATTGAVRWSYNLGQGLPAIAVQ